MKVGITGTRQQSDLRQLHRLSVFLEKAAPQIQELHHGDCLGVDAYAHTQAERWEIPIVIHPPTNDRYRAFCKGSKTTIRVAYPYLARNQHIVLESDLIVACPEGPEYRHPRSGTWSTVRFAQKLGKPVRIIYPDGTISEPQKKLL